MSVFFLNNNLIVFCKVENAQTLLKMRNFMRLTYSERRIVIDRVVTLLVG